MSVEDATLLDGEYGVEEEEEAITGPVSSPTKGEVARLDDKMAIVGSRYNQIDRFGDV